MKKMINLKQNIMVTRNVSISKKKALIWTIHNASIATGNTKEMHLMNDHECRATKNADLCYLIEWVTQKCALHYGYSRTSCNARR